VSGGRFINVRKLAAIDLHFRGSSFILLEFGFVVFFFGGIGLYALLSAKESLAAHAIGAYLVLLAIDYLPLLVYGIAIAKAGSASVEAEPEASDPSVYKRKYGVQQVLLLVPLVIPALAILQAAKHENRRKAAAEPPGSSVAAPNVLS
jgi:hypothetical protein